VAGYCSVVERVLLCVVAFAMDSTKDERDERSDTEHTAAPELSSSMQHEAESTLPRPQLVSRKQLDKMVTEIRSNDPSLTTKQICVKVNELAPEEVSLRRVMRVVKIQRKTEAEKAAAALALEAEKRSRGEEPEMSQQDASTAVENDENISKNSNASDVSTPAPKTKKSKSTSSVTDESQPDEANKEGENAVLKNSATSEQAKRKVASFEISSVDSPVAAKNILPRQDRKAKLDAQARLIAEQAAMLASDCGLDESDSDEDWTPQESPLPAPPSHAMSNTLSSRIRAASQVERPRASSITSRTVRIRSASTHKEEFIKEFQEKLANAAAGSSNAVDEETTASTKVPNVLVAKSKSSKSKTSKTKAKQTPAAQATTNTSEGTSTSTTSTTVKSDVSNTSPKGELSQNKQQKSVASDGSSASKLSMADEQEARLGLYAVSCLCERPASKPAAPVEEEKKVQEVKDTETAPPAAAPKATLRPVDGNIVTGMQMATNDVEGCTNMCVLL